MSDQPPSVVDRDNDRPRDHDEAVGQPTTDQVEDSIEAVAQRLGISVNAVRQRLKRGTLRGRKEAGGWVVFLPTDYAATGAPGRRPSDQPPTGPRPAANRPSDQGDIAPLAALIADLARQNAELAGSAAHWQARAMVLQERLAAIEAGPIAAAAPASADREYAAGSENTAPQRGDVPHGAQLSLNAASDAPASGAESLVARVWRRLTGH